MQVILNVVPDFPDQFPVVIFIKLFLREGFHVVGVFKFVT